MVQNPEICYSHVLAELSVNRKDPCEVIRELISNSYDAEASRIEIYPLLKPNNGFIFFDNGVGLQTKPVNGITPYKAFFSIGKSTKNQGEHIGYKCQGSKLCFASKKITVITRCIDEKLWRFISIDNPKDNLNPDYNIEPGNDTAPWNTLRDLLPRPNAQTLSILEHWNQDYFTNHFTKGTMIIVQGLDIKDFGKFYDSSENIRESKWSYLKHYIRFNTRHGDMRITKPNKTGFPNRIAENFKTTQGYNEDCQLFLWTSKKVGRKNEYNLDEIEAGYPYLEFPHDSEKIQISSPAKVSSLYHGRFSYRGAKTFSFEDFTYSVVFAIDGNRRALDKYQELGRQGYKKSGIRLTDQRGVFICSEGVKICQYDQLFEKEESHPLKEYSVLNTGAGKSHYIFMINGSFDVVTNRNSLAENSLRILNDNDFLDEIKKFLDTERRNSEIFRELIERLRKDNHATKLDTYTDNLDDLKNRIQYRPRFKVKDIEQLKEKWLIEPGVGEENSVGALYTMFAHLVPSDSEYAHLWLRPRTFSAMGIDSIAVDIEENGLAAKVHKALEYKYAFSYKDEFNHPLILTKQIVCWEMPEGETGDKIKDSYNYFGDVSCTEELDGIGYEIINLQSNDGDSNADKVIVISLKALLHKTFDCELVTPPPDKNHSKSKKRSKNSK